MRNRTIMTIFGTRPEAIKMAPVILALRERAEFNVSVAVTAQHRTMLDQVLDLFGIVPDVDLDILQDRQTLTSITTRALERISPAIEDIRPEMVVVQGDTTSTFVGALAAFYHRVPVAHVEAGLRTGDPRFPFPEEVNRRLTGQLADLHLPPTSTARENLLREGVPGERIVVTGNTVIDALLLTLKRTAGYGDPALADLDDRDRPVLLVTAHRRESWGDPMSSIGAAVADLARAEPELIVVVPIHRNPAVRESLLPHFEGIENIRVVEPLAYGSFAQLMNRSTLVLTDSGGIQEEAPSLGKPVLVMRSTTERPEAVAAGTARLVGTDREAIREASLRLLRDGMHYAAMARTTNPYGDGEAAKRVVDAIRHHFGDSPRPVEFSPIEDST